jgi:outer membrane biogenesis lipoprotein LolB
MQYIINVFLLLYSCLLFMACSDEGGSGNAETKNDHVWKEQTNTINKAKEVEGMMLESAEATRKVIEKQSE